MAGHYSRAISAARNESSRIFKSEIISETLHALGKQRSEFIVEAENGNVKEAESKLVSSVAISYCLLEYFLNSLENPYCYSGIFNTQFSKYVVGLEDGLALYAKYTGLMYSIFNTEFIVNYHCISHVRAGKRVYTVSDGLAAKLRETELRGVDSDDLNLPYRSIYVCTPPAAGLKIWNVNSGWHEVEGVYITEDPKVAGSRGWRLLVVGASKTEAINGWEDDAIVFFHIPLVPGQTVEECLGWLNEDKGNNFGKNKEVWRDIFSWVMNLILYCTWTEPKPESWMANEQARHLWSRIQKLPRGQKRERLKASFRELDPQVRYRMGIAVRRHQPIVGTRGENGHSSQRQIQTLVAGHWRRQAHGPERQLRKWLWIEPYWRHLDGTPEEDRCHEVR
jgi:hypothetical protein